MKVIHHPDCLLHNPPHEILSGRPTPYLESPTRIKRILHVLQSNPSFKLSEEVDSSIDVEQAILRVHKPEYLRYLETAYEEWVKDGGDKVCRRLSVDVGELTQGRVCDRPLCCLKHSHILPLYNIFSSNHHRMERSGRRLRMLVGWVNILNNTRHLDQIACCRVVLL